MELLLPSPHTVWLQQLAGSSSSSALSDCVQLLLQLL